MGGHLTLVRDKKWICCGLVRSVSSELVVAIGEILRGNIFLQKGFGLVAMRKKCIRIVASTSPSRIETHAGLFRLLLKGIFDPYALWPFDKKLISQLVTRLYLRLYDYSDHKLKALSFKTNDRKTEKTTRHTQMLDFMLSFFVIYFKIEKQVGIY